MTKKHKIVLVDKRTELMSIVLAFSQCNEYVEEHFSFDIDEEYRKEALEYFSAFCKHKSVKLSQEIAKIEQGFSYDNIILLAFELEENLEFKGRVSNRILKELNCENLLKEFLFALEDFAKISKFNEFYDKQQDYYLAKIEEIKNIFNFNSFLSSLNKILKIKESVNHFCINLIPMLINANHGFKVDDMIYANIGLSCEDFKRIDNFNNGYSHIIIHEFLHPFVNPYTERYLITKDLNQIESIPQHYNDISIVNDTIVRALTIRIREELSAIDTDKFLEREKSWGFSLVEEVYNKIKEFEDKDISWGEYFINILNIFSKSKDLVE